MSDDADRGRADTYAARCQDIRDSSGWLRRQLVADLAALINEGRFDGEGTSEGRQA